MWANTAGTAAMPRPLLRPPPPRPDMKERVEVTSSPDTSQLRKEPHYFKNTVKLQIWKNNSQVTIVVILRRFTVAVI